MEKKVEKLEERMLLLERFVEMRFCESFRDFSARAKRAVTTDNNYSNREDLIAEVLQRLQGSNLIQMNGNTFQGERSPSPPPASPPNSPPPVSRPQETSTARTSRRIAARKLNAKSLPSATILRTPTVKLNRIEAPSSDPLETETTIPVIVKQCVERDEEVASEEDDYFSYVGGGDGDDALTPPPVDNDQSPDFDPDADSDEETGSSPKKRKTTKRKSTPGSNYSKKTPLDLKKIELTKDKLASLLEVSVISNSSIIAEDADSKQCDICKKFWKLSLFPQHMLMHTKERTLKCGFCEKMFFNASLLRKHERKHQPDKFGMKCRVDNCSKMFVERDKQLSHERTCIRRALENGVEVAVDVMEDVKARSRSTAEELRWPSEPLVKGPKEKVPKRKGKYCGHCKIWIEKGYNEHHQELHAKWKCPLCPEENGRKYAMKQKLIEHMVKFHNKNKSEAEDAGGSAKQEVAGEVEEEGEKQMQEMDVDQS